MNILSAKPCPDCEQHEFCPPCQEEFEAQLQIIASRRHESFSGGANDPNWQPLFSDEAALLQSAAIVTPKPTPGNKALQQLLDFLGKLTSTQKSPRCSELLKTQTNSSSCGCGMDCL